jgi:hypothetical protein
MVAMAVLRITVRALLQEQECNPAEEAVRPGMAQHLVRAVPVGLL